MEQTELKALIALLDFPAFFAQDGRVLFGNKALCALVQEEHAKLSSFLTLRDEAPVGADPVICTGTVAGRSYRVKRSHVGAFLLYLLEPEPTALSSTALENTAVVLRKSLQQMYSAAEALGKRQEDEDPTLCSLLQSVFRVARVAEQLDAMQQLQGGTDRLLPQQTELKPFFGAIFLEAEELFRAAGLELRYRLPHGEFSGAVYPEMLALAIWNLLANAAANANGGAVEALLERPEPNVLRFTVCNETATEDALQRANLFARYAEPPELSQDRKGIGLGMSLIRLTAQLHDGGFTVLQPQNGKVTAVATFRTVRPGGLVLRAPTLRLERGMDAGLVALAEVLPKSAYDGRDIFG